MFGLEISTSKKPACLVINNLIFRLVKSAKKERMIVKLLHLKVDYQVGIKKA